MVNNDALMLVPSESIDGYIRTINSIPFLTAEEEYELAFRFKESADPEAAKKLVLSHLRFVVSIARGYMGYGLLLSDLIQEGTLGLMKAVKKFDVTQGVRLAAFAVHWIKAEINDYVLKNWRLVKVATTKAQRKLFFKLRKLKQSIGWMNLEESSEVATQLGVSVDDVKEMEARLYGQDVSLESCSESSSENEEEKVKLPSCYLVDETSNFSENIEYNEDTKFQALSLNKILGTLDERSYFVIRSRWLEQNKLTLQELSSVLNVSVERVRQIEKNALSKIKNALIALEA